MSVESARRVTKLMMAETAVHSQTTKRKGQGVAGFDRLSSIAAPDSMMLSRSKREKSSIDDSRLDVLARLFPSDQSTPRKWGAVEHPIQQLTSHLQPRHRTSFHITDPRNHHGLAKGITRSAAAATRCTADSVSRRVLAALREFGADDVQGRSAPRHPATQRPQLRGSVRQGDLVCALPDAERDLGSSIDPPSRTFTPVPKHIQDGSEDTTHVPAAIISGAPMELQARTVRYGARSPSIHTHTHTYI